MPLPLPDGNIPASISVLSSNVTIKCLTPLISCILTPCTLVPVSPLSPFTGLNVTSALSPFTKLIVSVLLPSALSVTELD